MRRPPHAINHATRVHSGCRQDAADSPATHHAQMTIVLRSAATVPRSLVLVVAALHSLVLVVAVVQANRPANPVTVVVAVETVAVVHVASLSMHRRIAVAAQPRPRDVVPVVGVLARENVTISVMFPQSLT